MKRLTGILVLFLCTHAFAATTKNDDSCDIALLPAATLLLPYFEVDLDDQDGTTTLFTITNATNLDQIAHITLWTDYAYPVIDFNIFLTGYDVQAINLYDILERGIIAPDRGTGWAITDRGKFSDRNAPLDISACDRLPGNLDPLYIERMQQAFLHGRVPPLGVIAGCDNIGGEHVNATGYVTIDAVRACTTSLPTDASYFAAEIAFDNVFIGDYQQVDRGHRFSEGGPMVHIRAVPEGSAATTDAGFPRTFYSRYQTAAAPRRDRRQPLPSVFAARWIAGGPGFRTFFKIWREGTTSSGTPCAAYAEQKNLKSREVVIFDEAENAVTGLPQCTCTFDPPPYIFLPTSMTDIRDGELYPQFPQGDEVAGWAYLNLDVPDEDGVATQAWVIASMRAENQFSVDMDAVALGNGCSPAAALSEVSDNGSAVIGPRP